MRALLMRLTGCALISMVLVELTKGPMREILRLGCGALMILSVCGLLMRELPQPASILPDPGQTELLQQQIQARLMEEQKQAVSRALSDYIARQGSAAGAVCTGRVLCETDPDGLDRIRGLEIQWYSGSPAAKDALRRSLAHDFSLPQAQIVIEEMMK